MKLRLKEYSMKTNNMIFCKCDITDRLDKLADVHVDKNGWRMTHYIMIDKDIEKGEMHIRIPGGTLGYIKINPIDFRITDIHVTREYIVHSYPENINDILKEYIDEQLEIVDFFIEYNRSFLQYLKVKQ